MKPVLIFLVVSLGLVDAAGQQTMQTAPVSSAPATREEALKRVSDLAARIVGRPGSTEGLRAIRGKLKTADDRLHENLRDAKTDALTNDIYLKKLDNHLRIAPATGGTVCAGLAEKNAAWDILESDFSESMRRLDEATQKADKLASSCRTEADVAALDRAIQGLNAAKAEFERVTREWIKTNESVLDVADRISAYKGLIEGLKQELDKADVIHTQSLPDAEDLNSRYQRITAENARELDVLSRTAAQFGITGEVAATARLVEEEAKERSSLSLRLTTKDSDDNIKALRDRLPQNRRDYDLASKADSYYDCDPGKSRDSREIGREATPRFLDAQRVLDTSTKAAAQCRLSLRKFHRFGFEKPHVTLKVGETLDSTRFFVSYTDAPDTLVEASNLGVWSGVSLPFTPTAAQGGHSFYRMITIAGQSRSVTIEVEAAAPPAAAPADARVRIADWTGSWDLVHAESAKRAVGSAVVTLRQASGTELEQAYAYGLKNSCYWDGTRPVYTGTLKFGGGDTWTVVACYYREILYARTTMQPRDKMPFGWFVLEGDGRNQGRFGKLPIAMMAQYESWNFTRKQ